MAMINVLAKMKKKVSPAITATLLKQAEYDAISSRYPRKVRQQIEGKWGFTRLIQDLAGSKSTIAKWFPTLLHGYGMASHLQHSDAVGIGMVAERESRPEPDRSRVKLAHIARIVSDCNAYSFMRLMSAYLCAEEDTKPVHEAWEKHRKDFDDLIEIQKEWEQVEFP
jgi:adenylylsulfate kinase-like enzyme